VTDRNSDFHDLFLDLRIEDQLAYYEARRTEYLAAHRQAVVLRTILLLGAAAAGIVGQGTTGTARAVWAVVGALCAALAGAVTGYETLVGFPQLEKLYRDTVRNLEEARADWKDVDPRTTDAAEVERVEDVFRSERGQWGQLIVKSAATPPKAEPTPTKGEPTKVEPTLPEAEPTPPKGEGAAPEAPPAPDGPPVTG
jgi:hypothetical protein